MIGVFLDFPNSLETPWHSGRVHLFLASEVFLAERSHPYSCCSTVVDTWIQWDSIWKAVSCPHRRMSYPEQPLGFNTRIPTKCAGRG